MDRYRKQPAAILMTGLIVFGAGGCQMSASQTPARLKPDDRESLAALSSALSDILGRARIEFGAMDAGSDYPITVLPAPPGPYETNSPAMPIHFALVMEAGRCMLIRQDTGEEHVLTGVDCEPKKTAP